MQGVEWGRLAQNQTGVLPSAVDRGTPVEPSHQQWSKPLARVASRCHGFAVSALVFGFRMASRCQPDGFAVVTLASRCQPWFLVFDRSDGFAVSALVFGFRSFTVSLDYWSSIVSIAAKTLCVSLYADGRRRLVNSPVSGFQPDRWIIRVMFSAAFRSDA